MSIQIVRECVCCQVEERNPIFYNWTEEALMDEDFMHKHYKEWMCEDCDTRWLAYFYLNFNILPSGVL